MFVERLTEEQVKDFFNEQYDKDRFKYELLDSKLHVSIKYIRDSIEYEYDNYWLLDFNVAWAKHTITLVEDWIKYLYKIFGEEYKEAYLAECAKIF